MHILPRISTCSNQLGVLTVCSEKPYDLLIQAFCLTVGLGMVAGCEADIDVEMFKEGGPYP